MFFFLIVHTSPLSCRRVNRLMRGHRGPVIVFEQGEKMERTGSSRAGCECKIK